ncbi:metallophosphoesterase [Akkermansiaceae bacterium]|nr:metallophosphoesterase [Akkermansiaceae bacterium]
MPILLPPLTRRQFIKGSLALGGTVGGTAMMTSRALVDLDREGVELDQNRVALLADTHISADPNRVYPGTKWPGSPVKESEHESVHIADSLLQTAKSVIALNPRPAHLIVNGDCAFGRGSEAEYKEFLKLVEPIRAAGITIHVTIGNHDNRENLWKLLPFLKKEKMGIQACVIELSHANLILLDSGKKGILGEKQLNWLAKELDERADKPALIFGHFNPYPNRGVRPIKGLRDGPVLLKILTERPHAKAYFYGHTHEWQHDQRDHLHLINQPAVSYYFGKGHAHGWVDMKLTEGSADLELHCLKRKHPQHGERRKISLKDKPITVRVASYNVEFGKSATPEEIGEMLKPYKLDIIGFDEAPDGDWTAHVGKVLGMEHSYVGKISSANHKDKYKTILSRTPLEDTEEYELTGRGWNPASVVRAVTQIDGVPFAFYSLHISKSGAKDGHAYSLASKVLPKEITERVIVAGDFNNKIGDAAMKTIEGAGFRPTWNDLKIDVSKEFTYNAQNPEKNLGVIDHIFYNKLSGAKATEGGIIELAKPLSDHKPIWAEIAFARKLKKVKGSE